MAPVRGALMCALLSGATLFLVGCGGGGGSVTPKSPEEIISSIDKLFSDDYDNQEFSKVADLYTADAILIPPTADSFIQKKGIEDFFNASYKQGLHPIHLTPKVVVRENDTVMHEIGTVDLLQNPYYVRWVKNGDDNDDWQINTDIMSIGGNLTKANESKLVATKGNETPMEIITAKDKLFSKLYNAGNYSDVANLYAKDAQLIGPIDPVAKGTPVKIPSFVKRDALAAFFSSMNASGLTSITLTPKHVLMQGGNVIHEIGTTDKTPDPYYVRWILEDGDWKLSMDIMAIGEGSKSVKPKTVVV